MGSLRRMYPHHSAIYIHLKTMKKNPMIREIKELAVPIIIADLDRQLLKKLERTTHRKVDHRVLNTLTNDTYRILLMRCSLKGDETILLKFLTVVTGLSSVLAIPVNTSLKR